MDNYKNPYPYDAVGDAVPPEPLPLKRLTEVVIAVLVAILVIYLSR